MGGLVAMPPAGTKEISAGGIDTRIADKDSKLLRIKLLLNLNRHMLDSINMSTDSPPKIKKATVSLYQYEYQ